MVLKALIDEQYSLFLRQMIDSASSTIYASIYYCHFKAKNKNDITNIIVQKLITKATMGVDVRLLIHLGNVPRIMFNYNKCLVSQLKNTKVKVRCWKKSRILHAKMFLFDETSVVTGSHNISNTSMRQSAEVSIATDYISVVKDLKEKYWEWWNQGVD